VNATDRADDLLGDLLEVEGRQSTVKAGDPLVEFASHALERLISATTELDLYFQVETEHTEAFRGGRGVVIKGWAR
jgi:hypothetical protein